MTKRIALAALSALVGIVGAAARSYVLVAASAGAIYRMHGRTF